LTKLDNSDITDEEREEAVKKSDCLLGSSTQFDMELQDKEDFSSIVAAAQTGPPSPLQIGGPQYSDVSSPTTERRGNIVKAISFLLDDLDTKGLMEIRECVKAKMIERGHLE